MHVMSADLRMVGMVPLTLCVGTCSALIGNYQNMHFRAKAM